MYGVQIPLVCLFMIIMLVIVYYAKRKAVLYENVFYSRMLVGSLFFTVVNNILHFVAGSYPLEVINNDFSLFFHIGNSISGLLVVFVGTSLFLYNLYIVNKDKVAKKQYNTINYIIPILFFVIAQFLSVTVVRTGYINNISGSMANAIYVSVGILIIMSLIVAIRNPNKKETKNYGIYFIVLITLFLVVISYFIPSIMINDLILVYLVYIMYFTIENPDIKMLQQVELAKDTAEKANRAKSDFLSSMSHEIRTPLNAIVGFSELIDTAKNLDEAKEDAKDIVMASNTLLEIVNSILDISKIEAGKMELTEVDYPTSKLFKDVESLIKARIGEKDIEFKIQIAPDIPTTLKGDQANIRKVLINVLTNAVKYTERGYISLVINSVTKNDTCRLFVSVKDTGRGIKPDQVQKLFTKFQRLEEDKNTTIEGTGLGLAITKQLIEMMGGSITVKSTYGEGSEFIIALDQKIVSNSNIDDYYQLETDKTNRDLSNYKVLVVDDNTLNLKVAERLFSKFNLQVESVTSGFECIEKIGKENKYDLIFMDDMMPRMSGTETYTELRKIPGFNTPVVALTANALSENKQKYLNLGFNGYLAKPIEKEELIKVLNTFLRQK